MNVRYEEMLPSEIVRRRAAFPAAFVPLGTLEWHGDHSVPGLDSLKAHRLCEMAAAASGGFAFPALWYGEPRTLALMDTCNDTDGEIKRRMGFQPEKCTEAFFGKTAEEQVSFYQELLRHTLRQLCMLEMKAIILVCGHYPLKNMATPAVAAFNASISGTRAHVANDVDFIRPGTLEYRADHAGKWETSMLMYLRPECVTLDVYKDGTTRPAGCLGEDPRLATVENGRRVCEAITEGLVETARTLLAQQ